MNMVWFLCCAIITVPDTELNSVPDTQLNSVTGTVIIFVPDTGL